VPTALAGGLRNERRRELRRQLTARRSLVDLLNHPATQTPQAKDHTAGTTPAVGRRLKLAVEVIGHIGACHDSHGKQVRRGFVI